MCGRHDALVGHAARRPNVPINVQNVTPSWGHGRHMQAPVGRRTRYFARQLGILTGPGRPIIQAPSASHTTPAHRDILDPNRPDAATSRRPGAHAGTPERTGRRVVGTVGRRAPLAASAPAAPGAGRRTRRRWLDLAGAAQRRRRQVAPADAHSASGIDQGGPSGRGHPGQGVAPCTLKRKSPHEPWRCADFQDVVPAVGFELTTCRLQGGCSTN